MLWNVLTVETEREVLGDGVPARGGYAAAVIALVPQAQAVALQCLQAAVSFLEGAVLAGPHLLRPIVLRTIERPETKKKKLIE